MLEMNAELGCWGQLQTRGLCVSVCVCVFTAEGGPQDLGKSQIMFAKQIWTWQHRKEYSR